MDVRKNLTAFAKSKGMFINEFERKVGWKEGSIRRITPGVSLDKLQMISKVFPDFDPATCSSSRVCDINKVIVEIESQIKTLQENLDRLKELSNLK